MLWIIWPILIFVYGLAYIFAGSDFFCEFANDGSCDSWKNIETNDKWGIMF
jgi:hypothetical protein